MMQFKGIKIGEKETKIALFMDDLFLFMSNPEEAIERICQVFEEFGKFSGFKVNTAKTEILILSSKNNMKWEGKYPFKEFKVSPGKDAGFFSDMERQGDLNTGPVGECEQSSAVYTRRYLGKYNKRALSLAVLKYGKLERSQFAPGGHVSPEMEQVSSPGSASSTQLQEHHGDEDDEDDEDDAAEETEIQSSDHEEVPIETVVPPNRPSTSTYDAIVASEGKIVDAENRRHSDMMTVLERMIGLQEETVSQLAHLHRVFIEVPKQLQKINTSFEALVVQQTQANYWRMTNVPQFNTSQAGSLHAGHFSPHSSDLQSPGPNVTGQVAHIGVQVPDDILPLPSVLHHQLTPTKEATKTQQHKQLVLTRKDETDQPCVVHGVPTCSHVSLPTSPVGEQSLPKSPVGESLPTSPVGESLPKSPVGESLPTSPVGESLPISPAREVPEATQSGSVVAKVGGKRKKKMQETTSREEKLEQLEVEIELVQNNLKPFVESREFMELDELVNKRVIDHEKELIEAGLRHTAGSPSLAELPL
ncbi:uncharacterized protein LOC142488175 [Ascaphus truei]|uniref:uncharacterized protein LOC142488175 n=1 Tax=Ascaphus truei TaxID=8439 RepID=UPI003F5995DF